MLLSRTHDEVFWYNALTGESRWNKPPPRAPKEGSARPGTASTHLEGEEGGGGASSSLLLDRTPSGSSSLLGAEEQEELHSSGLFGRLPSVGAPGRLPSAEAEEEEEEAFVPDGTSFDPSTYHGEFRLQFTNLRDEHSGNIPPTALLRVLRQQGLPFSDAKRVVAWVSDRADAANESLTHHSVAIVMTLLAAFKAGYPVPGALPEGLEEAPPFPKLQKKGMVVDSKRSIAASRHWALGHTEGATQKKAMASRNLTLQEAAAARLQAWVTGYVQRHQLRAKRRALDRILRSVKVCQIQNWFRRRIVHLRKDVEPAAAEVVNEKADDPLHHRVMFRIKVFCKGWLRRARQRLLDNLRNHSALVIQRKYRGTKGLQRIRKMRYTRLMEATVVVQRAWRRRLAWIKLMREEEERTAREAKRLADAYLFGGKGQKEAARQRRQSIVQFEGGTSELGRRQRRKSVVSEAGLMGEGGGHKSSEQLQAGWLATLKQMLRAEDPSSVEAQSPDAGGGVPPPGGQSRRGSVAASSDHGSVAGAAEPPKREGRARISKLFEYTGPRNPDQVENSISEQRGGGAKSLHLVGMKMQRWPFGVTDARTGRPLWTWLQSVHVSNNQLPGLPMDFWMLTNLTDLRLDGNKIGGLPPNIGTFTILQSLWLHDNVITSLPAEIGILSQLTNLTLHQNKLQTLPFELCNLRCLRKLPMHDNPLVSPPLKLALDAVRPKGLHIVLVYLKRFLESLDEPHVLSLENFHLETLPGDFTRIKECRQLILRKNALADLDADVFWDRHFKMRIHRSLTRLDVSHNRLTELPEIVTRLVTLNSINISANLIARIPMSIVKLSSLTTLKARENPLVYPPMEVVDHGVEVYLLAGSRAHKPHMGMFYKTLEKCCGRPVYMKQKHGQENVDQGGIDYVPPEHDFSKSKRAERQYRPGSTPNEGGRPRSRQSRGSRPSTSGSGERPATAESRESRESRERPSTAGSKEERPSTAGSKGSKEERPSTAGSKGSKGDRPSTAGSKSERPSTAGSKGSKGSQGSLPASKASKGSKDGKEGGGGDDGSRPSTASRPPSRPSTAAGDRPPSALRSGADARAGKAKKTANVLIIGEDEGDAGETPLEMIVPETTIMFFSTVCTPHSWLVGPDTDPANAYLRALDDANTPSEITADWVEVRPKGKWHHADKVFIRGVGVFEFCWRSLKYSDTAAMLKKMKRDFRANEDIWRRTGDIPKLIEVQKANKEAYNDASQKLAVRFGNMALRTLPKECVDMGGRLMLLDNNLLRRLPDELCNMQRLQELTLENNLIRAMPSGMRRLSSLTRLNVSCNDLCDLPATVSALTNLTLLDLTRNRFAVAPDVEELSNLTELRLDHNQLATLPLSYSSLYKLTLLGLNMNNLETLDDPRDTHGRGALHGMASLRELELDGNQLSHIPESARALTQMTRIRMSRNPFHTLKSITTAAKFWHSLTKLVASEATITSMPNSLKELKHLLELDLSKNDFSVFPVALETLPGLQVVNLSFNYIKVIPPTVDKLVSLKSLSIDDNILVLVAPEIMALTNLETLSLAGNKISSLPPFCGMTSIVLGKLQNLKHFDVSNNKLKYLPLDVANLQNLETLSVAGNPYVSPLLRAALRPCLGTLTLHILNGKGMPLVNHQGKPGQKGSKNMSNPMVEALLYHNKTISGGTETQLEEMHRTTIKHDAKDPIWTEFMYFKMIDYRDHITVNLRHGLPLLADADQQKIGEPVLGDREFPVLAAVLMQDIFWSAMGLETLINVAKHVKKVVFHKGEVLTTEGDCDGRYFFVMSGELQMYRVDSSGSNRPCGTIAPLQGHGGHALLTRAAQQETLIAKKTTVLFMLQPDASAAKPAKGEVFNPNKAPPRLTQNCLSAAISKNARGLLEQMIWVEKQNQDPKNADKDAAWGSAGWTKERNDEYKALKTMLKMIESVHFLQDDEYRSIDQEIETVNRSARDRGESLLEDALQAPIITSRLTFRGEDLKDKKGNYPVVRFKCEVKGEDSVDAVLAAITKVASGDEEAKEAEQDAMKTFLTHVRRTPPGIDFEVETDPVKYDDEIAKMTAFTRDILDQRALGKVKTLWESMPRFLAGSGSTERPWDTAFRSKDDYASGEFWGMSALAEYIAKFQEAGDIKVGTGGGLNRKMLEEVTDQIEQSKPKHEYFAKEKSKTEQSRERTKRWEWFVGLVLLKQHFLLEREARNDVLSWQDQQLKAMRDFQEETSHKERMAVIKQDIAVIEKEMHQCSLNVKESVEALRAGWNLEWVMKYKENKERREELKPKLSVLLASKMQQKTFYKLGMSLSRSMEWKKPAALRYLFEVFSEQCDESLDPVGALSNIQGGAIEPDLLDRVWDADAEAPGAGMDPTRVCKWLTDDPKLKRVPARRAKMMEMIQRYNIDGKTLFNCGKIDLQRMGLAGPNARLLLSRVHALMKEKGTKTKRRLTQVEVWSAEYALIVDEKQGEDYLVENLLLGPLVLQELRDTFTRYDPSNHEEIPCNFMAKILAESGDFLHPNEAARLSKIADPEGSGSTDFVGFCAAMKETSFVVGGYVDKPELGR